MFRNSTNFEQEEHGLVHVPTTIYSKLSGHREHRDLYTQVSKAKPMCQAGIGPDVLIETEHMGPVPACEITSKHRVLTLDNGYRPVLWAGAAWRDGQETVTDTAIQISPGALGKATHGENAYYAPGQHVLLQSPLNEMFFCSHHVLARAEFLTHLNGVTRIKNNPIGNIVNLLFDRVEMVQAEGLWVESLVPEMQKPRLGHVQAEIEAVVPQLRYEHGYAAYIHNLPILNEKEVKMLKLNGL